MFSRNGKDLGAKFQEVKNYAHWWAGALDLTPPESRSLLVNTKESPDEAIGLVSFVARRLWGERL